MKSGQERTEKMVLGSIDCYMRGEKNLKWIEGIIKTSGLRKEVLKRIFAAYRETYAERPMFQELEKKCIEMGYI